MTKLVQNLPWLDRYRTIIRGMLPSESQRVTPPPFQQIAAKITGGKAAAMPETISALQGLPLIRAVWGAVGDINSRTASVPTEVEKVISHQASDGHLLLTTANDHPESVWYFELQLTHALATAGLLLNNQACFAAAQRAATFILNEIQPDHATNRPWGITAFLLAENTLPLVDWVLHSATVHLTTTDDEMTLLLLKDCLYCFST